MSRKAPEIIRITQDRITEKRTLIDAGVKVAPYEVIHSKAELLNGIEQTRISMCFKNKPWRI